LIACGGPSRSRGSELRGKTWTQVSHAVGLSVKAAQVSHNDYLSWDVEAPDALATVDRSIAIRSAAINRLDEIAQRR